MKRFLIVFLVFSSFCVSTAQTFISEKAGINSFPLCANGNATGILYDVNDAELVSITVNLFSQDVERVTSHKPAIYSDLSSVKNTVIILGTLQGSSFIKQLVSSGKLNANNVNGKWDGYMIEVVKSPFAGIDQALVIVGNDKRGAAYGALEISRQMGVSPWYWWADVPVQKKKELYFKSDTPLVDAPKVKYRGFFINDEAPCFSEWTKEKFGGVNHQAYEKIFELLLRLKANYLWPAMWNNAFNDDDKLNQPTADKWGIVMGTSHHEPMQRAQKEWKRYGKGAWDYVKNDSILKDFWRTGIKNMGSYESLVTIGMRGDGDEPMTSGTATELLERIVKDQRHILEEVTLKPASKTPQLWALYKEVQEYYDQGMRVPDDVTLLLCDDNWGNIRKLPKLNDKARTGGYGLYYHFDYVGDPRNYKWINTNNIARVWEQMHLAYEYGVKDIWIVNVGDIKPMEFPLSFFMDYAWNPEQWDEKNIMSYYTDWAGTQFGEKYGQEIGGIMREYAHLAARRKPELLDAKTYSIQNYDESQNVISSFNKLLEKAEKVNRKIPAAFKDAYFQVVLHPLKANANLHEMYQAVAWNQYYTAENNALANTYADKVKLLFEKDSLLSVQYNKELANGKWNHMMDQVHIGYKSWNDPRYNIMPKVTYVQEAATNKPFSPSAKNSQSAEKMIAKGTKGNVFYEKDGVVSIEAEHFSRAVGTANIRWGVIPDIGRASSGITNFPVTAARQPPGNSPCAAYDFYCYEGQIDITIAAYFSPTLNFHNNDDGLKYAISIDGEAPQVVTVNVYDDLNIWRSWTANNIIIKNTKHKILTKGKHTVKYWMVDSGVILQKIVLDFGGLQPSYLGPAETLRK
jgi:Glycosyl hydrolase family 115/Gylcosyl hydrolase family 115 C-terminal domain